MQILLMLFFALVLYVFTRIMLKEPVLFWKEKKNVHSKTVKLSKGKKDNRVHLNESDAGVFRDLVSDIEGISHHMLRHKDNKFVMYAEVTPVNYFLLSQQEQAAIDASFERWLATLEHNVQWYLQNRYVDLSEPIQQMSKNMNESDNLPKGALEYGTSMIEELEAWQKSQPRYETKRYILFIHQVNTGQIEAETTEEFEEKLYDKAFAELYRRFNASKQSLQRCKMQLNLLTNEGIVEVLYYALNRKKALKNKFKDVQLHEMLSEYVTADQDEDRIELVKEMIESELTKESKVV